jgi:hypothetical protein
VEKKEEYQISTSMNDGILEIIIIGSVNGRNISKLQKEVDTLRIVKGDKLLLDIRSISEGSGYSDALYHLRRPEMATGKTAIVDIPENEQNKSFFETILTHNTNMKVKWFSNINVARDWLKCTQRNSVELNL